MRTGNAASVGQGVGARGGRARGGEVDHARARRTDKRGGPRKREALDVALAHYEDRAPDILELEEVLAQLEAVDPQVVRIVDLRFFGGHTIEEAARILDVSHGTVERGWRTARLWLAKELAPDGSDRSTPEEESPGTPPNPSAPGDR